MGRHCNNDGQLRRRFGAGAFAVAGSLAWSGWLGGLGLSRDVFAQSGSQGKNNLKILGDSSLSEFLKPLSNSYQKAYPESVLELNLGVSDLLVTHALTGKPVDVILTADEISISRLINADLVSTNEVGMFATNSLVLVSLRPIMAVDALRDAAEFKKVAVANPQNSPDGRYSRDSLVYSGVWRDLQGRIVWAQDAEQALGHVLAGRVDAAVVYRSTLHAVRDNRLTSLPLAGPGSVRYFVAALRSSRNRAHALRFVQLVRSEPARQLLIQQQFYPLN